MIDLVYVLGFSMGVVNLFKNKIPEKYRDITSYIALLLAVILNIVNALIFKGDTLVAFREAFVSCGIALGCFNLGKSVKNIVDKNNN